MSPPVILFDVPVLEAAVDVAIDHPELIPQLLTANGRDMIDVGESRFHHALLKELSEAHARGEHPDREVLASRVSEASGSTREDVVQVLSEMHARTNPQAFPLFVTRLNELRFRRRLAVVGEQAQNGHAFADLVLEVQALGTSSAAPGARLFEEIDVATAIRAGVPPIRFDLAPYLAAGTLTIISGLPKSAKTWIALAWSVCLVSGRSFCGMPPEGEHRILFLEAEYPRQIILRFGQLCRGLQVNPEAALKRIRFIRPRLRLQLEDPAHAAALLMAAEEYGATMCVIDSLRRVHGLDENSSRDMANLADGALLPLRGNEQRTVLAIDHDAKPWMMGNRPKSQHLRGSGDKLASADVLLHVEKHEAEGAPRRYELTIAASRVAEEDGESLWLALHSTPEDGVRLEAGDPVQQDRKGRPRRPRKVDQAVNIILAERGRKPDLKFIEAVIAVKAADLSEATAARAWRKCQLSDVSKRLLIPDTGAGNREVSRVSPPPLGVTLDT